MIRYVGALGAGILLIAFALLEFRKLSREKPTFHLLNLIGAILLFGYAYTIKSYIFVILNLAWAFVAIYEIQKVKK
ncbi:MAG: hypothetical protein V3V78_01330 [Candidatus Woesearchaeota archaeon]